MRTWVDRWPARLASEREGLERLGLAVDEWQLRNQRRLVASGDLTVADRGVVDVTIVYPDSFPHLRPEVMAPQLALGRHQNPYQGNLCLLDRSTREWEVTDTGAWLLTERLPLLLELLSAGGQQLRDGEAPQGEPWTSYLITEPGTAVFVTQQALAISPVHSGGRLEFATPVGEAPSGRLRGLLRSVTVADGTVVATAPQALRDSFTGGALQGRWVRLAAPPTDPTPNALLAAAVAADPRLAQPRWRHTSDGSIDVIGCLVNEEVAQGRDEQGWMFVVRIMRAAGPRRRQQAVYATRGERASRADLAARIPALGPLAERSVLLLGAGTLGAPIALELARCGINKLTILDAETVEAGNTVRWPFGFSAVGWPKAGILASAIQGNFPYTEVTGLTSRIGQAAGLGDLSTTREQSELDGLERLIADADLVIDATAELGVQHLLSELAVKVPQLYVWATEGAAGGVVARVTAANGCWMCLQLHIRDRALPEPYRLEQDTVQPRGCATPTFTGTSYDLAAVSNQAVRVALAQLLGRDLRGVDVTVCSLRDDQGWLPTPLWSSAPLERHGECELCDRVIAA
jgi:hypothetical protein